MNIKLSFRDFSNLVYNTEMDNEEIHMLTNIADNIAEALLDSFKGRHDININEYVDIFEGNIFEVPIHDDNLKRIDVDFSKTCYLESVRRFVCLAYYNKTKIYSVENIKYVASSDETIIYFKAYNQREESEEFYI